MSPPIGSKRRKHFAPEGSTVEWHGLPSCKKKARFATASPIDYRFGADLMKHLFQKWRTKLLSKGAGATGLVTIRGRALLRFLLLNSHITSKGRRPCGH